MAEPADAPRRRSVGAVTPPDPGQPASTAAGEATTDETMGDAVTHEAGTHEPGTHEPGTCPVAWCPVCLAVTAVQPVRPEVVEHLLKAGTEFFLALRSLIDARADDLDASAPDDDADGGFERIDIG